MWHTHKESETVTEDTHSRVTGKLRQFQRTKRFDPRKMPSMNQLSLHETTTFHWDLEQDVTACQDTGIQAIGVWRRKLDEYGCERGIEFLNDSGIRVSSLSWAGGFTGANGMSFEEAVQDTREAIQVAGAINAGCLLIAVGGRNGHIWTHANNLLVVALNELSAIADDCNVSLALQPMTSSYLANWSFLSSLESTMQVIRRCDHPRVRLAFDAGELWEEPKLFERIAQVAPDTAIVQLNDALSSPLSINDRRLPGDGDVPLGEITQAFLKHGYSGDFELALWSDDLWQRDYLNVIHDCRVRFDDICRV